MSAITKPVLLAVAFAMAVLALSAPALAAKGHTTTTTTTSTKTATATTSTRTKTTAAGTTTAPKGPTGKSCWRALIRDWYDGRIDKTYPIHCYQDALKHLPQDVRTYSDAYDVISRALAAATRGKKKVDPDALIAPPASGGTGTTSTPTTPGGGPTGTNGGPSAGGGPIGGVLTTGDQGSDGVPIPLLVLAGLAVLLVAGGGAGLIVRRLQARRSGP